MVGRELGTMVVVVVEVVARLRVLFTWGVQAELLLCLALLLPILSAVRVVEVQTQLATMLVAQTPALVVLVHIQLIHQVVHLQTKPLGEVETVALV
jgi:hypothetical protein